MALNWSGIIAVVLSLATFWVTRRWSVRWAKRIRIFWLVGLFLLSLPGFGFSIYYFHLLPEYTWFYELRSFRGSEFLLVFCGAFAALWSTFFHRRLVIVWLFFLFAGVAVPFIKPILGPIPNSAFEDRWKDGACLQSTPSTCGPSTVATIVSWLGTPVNERDVARACYSYNGGTEAWYLARYVRSLGFKPTFIFESNFRDNMPLPCVAGVRMSGAGHFIALLQRDGDYYLVADPLVGLVRVPNVELKGRYSFSGFYMPISTSSDTIKAFASFSQRSPSQESV